MLRKLHLFLGALLIVGSAIAFVVVRGTNLIGSSGTAQNSRATTQRRSNEKVNRNALPNQLRWALKELGDRLDRSGKERLSIVGVLRVEGKEPAQAQMIAEFPDRLRLSVQEGSSGRIITFNGSEAKRSGASPDLAEREMVESLIYDTAEHFFLASSRGLMVRSLGNRYRSDDGSYHDVYELLDQVNVDPTSRQQAKLYYFNSETQLLEKVRYQTNRNGVPVWIETRLGNWQKKEGQLLASRIARLEEGKPIWTLDISSAATSARVDDGIFERP
jgi:hypothetical protein